VPWSTSTRRQSLPPDWAKRRAALLKANPTCTCPGCPSCTGRPCTAPSTDADHLGHPDDHDDLGAKCQACHGHRTQGQATAARRALYARAKHRPERHPGLL
jgi:hypothetical protein